MVIVGDGASNEVGQLVECWGGNCGSGTFDEPEQLVFVGFADGNLFRADTYPIPFYDGDPMDGDDKGFMNAHEKGGR
jgi:hypothetical protein